MCIWRVFLCEAHSQNVAIVNGSFVIQYSNHASCKWGWKRKLSNSATLSFLWRHFWSFLHVFLWWRLKTLFVVGLKLMASFGKPYKGNHITLTAQCLSHTIVTEIPSYDRLISFYMLAFTKRWKNYKQCKWGQIERATNNTVEMAFNGLWIIISSTAQFPSYLSICMKTFNNKTQQYYITCMHTRAYDVRSHSCSHKTHIKI